MPITIPIEGAGSVSYEERRYPALASIQIVNSETESALAGVTVQGDTLTEAVEAIEISKVTESSVPSSIQIVNNTLDEYLQSAEIVTGDSWLILADLISSDLTHESLAQQAFVEINCKLEVNGTELRVKDFNFQRPTGRIGSLLNATLGETDVDLVPYGASIDFSLLIKVGAVVHEYPLMTNGKLTSRTHDTKIKPGRVKGPADGITIGALDVIADRFTMRPRRPIIMFDPLRVRFDDIRTDPENAIRTRNGRIIKPIIEPVNGLSMRKIINRMYTSIGSGYANILSPAQLSDVAWSTMYAGNLSDVNQEGCGFDRVITNIKDYLVRQANASVESGYHAGADPTVTMYGPLYFPRGDNDLVILDIDVAPLPYGIVPYNATLSYHKSLSERIEFSPDKNSILVTYQYMGNDPYENSEMISRDVVDTTYPVDTSQDDDPIASGEEGYVKHQLKETVREFFMPEAPDEVLDTLPISTVLTVEQTYVLRDDAAEIIWSGVRTSSIERTDYFYDGDLKIRQDRTLETRVFTPETLTDRLESQMLTAQRERMYISWIDDPANPGVKLQDNVKYQLDELCVISPEAQTIYMDGDPIDHHPLIPLLDANLGGYLTEEWKLAGMKKSNTRTELLRKRKGNQYDVLITTIDHLNGGGAKISTGSPVTGSTRHNQYDVRSRTILLEDEASIAEIGPRIPDQVNAYELPRDRALELGQRRLDRFSNPLKAYPMDLPVPDLALAQGSVLRGQTREGWTGRFIVTGFSITGQGLGIATQHRIFQSLETIELLAQ